MSRIAWHNLPDETTSHHILEIALPYRGDGRMPPPAPYHFTLYVMFALYCHIQGYVRIKSGCAADHGQVLSIFEDIVREKHVPNPVSYDQALKTPLRALAYFSWERERRVFLVRRVYPTFFDFLSYSHVPEGWGAVGKMLNQVLESQANYQKKIVYTVIPDVRRTRSLIPYFSEVERLRYSSVLALPVFDSVSRDIPNLMGALVFYVKNKAFLPDEGDYKTKKRLQNFALEMEQALKLHEKAITRGSKPMARILRDHANRNEIAELTITLHPHNEIILLETMTASVMRALNGTDIVSIRDTTRRKPNTKTLLLVGHEKVDAQHFRAQVLNAVGNACEGHHYVSYRFKFGC
jgi:hypothetical protein